MESKSQENQEGGTSQDEEGSSPMMMGRKMMQKMMERMGPGGEDPQKATGPKTESSEGNLMGPMMGMCKEMLGTMHQTLDLAVYATPEVRALFGEWLDSLENSALKFLQDHGPTEPSTLAEALSISESLATSLMAQMKNRGKIRLRAEVRIPMKVARDSDSKLPLIPVKVATP